MVKAHVLKNWSVVTNLDYVHYGCTAPEGRYVKVRGRDSIRGMLTCGWIVGLREGPLLITTVTGSQYLLLFPERGQSALLRQSYDRLSDPEHPPGYRPVTLRKVHEMCAYRAKPDTRVRGL